MTIARLVPVALAALVLSGCSATYEERMTYLRKVANQGVETHQLLTAQEAPTVDKERCAAAWGGLNDVSDVPTVEGYKESIAWNDQVKEFFVDSCVSGKPKPLPGEPQSGDQQPSTTSSTPTSSSPAAPSAAVLGPSMEPTVAP